jgi:hypothetical protein
VQTSQLYPLPVPIRQYPLDMPVSGRMYPVPVSPKIYPLPADGAQTPAGSGTVDITV